MQIIFTEIPYQVNKARLIEKIGRARQGQANRRHMSDIRDESNRERYAYRHRTEKGCQPSDHPEQIIISIHSCRKLSA